MNSIIEKYKQMTGEDESETKCASCTNAIWRIAYGSAPDAYRTAKDCNLYGHCTAMGKPITAYVYLCSAHEPSDAAQGEELAGML